MKREIEKGEEALIGVGHGRTLAASVEYLPRTSAGKTRFVSLLGGLTRKFSANPHDVIHRLAERTGAEAYVMPVPFFANTVEDREVLLGQKGVSDVFDLAKSAHLLVVGIGTAEPEASLVSTGMIEKSEIGEIKRDGGAGELLGHFFDDKGSAGGDAAVGAHAVAWPRRPEGPPHRRHRRRQGEGPRHQIRAGEPISLRIDHRRAHGAGARGGIAGRVAGAVLTPNYP